MKCPFCAHLEDKVVDSREGKEGQVIRRRRECLSCGKRFTSYERIDQIPHMVIKKDGRRERFDREKVLAGLLKACEKREISVKTLEGVADKVETMVHENTDREVPSVEVGEYLMERLRELDKVQEKVGPTDAKLAELFDGYRALVKEHMVASSTPKS